jgi:hypothetical protein
MSKQIEKNLVEEIVDIIDVLSDRLSVIYETETDTREAIQRLELLKAAIETRESNVGKPRVT